MFGKSIFNLLFGLFSKSIVLLPIFMIFIWLCLYKIKVAAVLSLLLFIIPLPWIFFKKIFKKYLKKLDLQGVVLLFFFLYPLLPSLWGVDLGAGLPVLRAHRLITIILIFYLIRKKLLIKCYKDFFKEKTFGYPIFFVLSSLSLSSIFSEKAVSSIFFTLSLFFEYLILSVVIFSIFKKKEDLNRLINVICFSAGILCIIGLYEKVTHNNIYRIFGYYDSLFQRAMTHQMRGGDIRINGPFNHSIAFGSYLTLSLPFFLYKLKDQQLKFLASFVIIAVVIMATQSRAAQIGMFIIFIFYFLFIVKKKNIIIIMFFFIPLLVPLVITEMDQVGSYLLKLDPFGSSDEALAASSGARFEQFFYFIKFIKKNLILGHGNMEPPPFMRGTPYGGEGNYETSIDNFYLMFSFHWGLMGLAGWLFLMMDTIIKPIIFFRKEIFKNYLLILTILGIIVFCIINMVVALYSFHFVYWIYIGILARLIVNERNEQASHDSDLKLSKSSP